MEAGQHELANGSRLEVGTVDTAATVGKQVADQWEYVGFETSFPSAPVVLSQIQTALVPDFLHTRQNAIAANGLQIALEQEQAIV